MSTARYTVEVSTMNIGEDTQRLIRDELSNLGVDSQISSGLALSRGFPGWIQFIWDLPTWKKIMLAGATFYGKTWVEQLAKYNFDNRAKLLATVRKAAGTSIGAIGKFAELIVNTVERTNGGTPVTVEFPDLGIILDTTVKDRDEALAIAAGFTNYADAIAGVVTEIKERVKKDQKITVTIQDIGFTLTWKDPAQNQHTQAYLATGEQIHDNK